jgi:hypothetical protein
MIIVVIIAAISVSTIFFTQAIAISEPVSISVKRVERYDDVIYIQISSSVLSSYSSILKLINEAEYQKYGDDFYTELGRLLMKNEMQSQMQSGKFHLKSCSICGHYVSNIPL